MFNPLKAIKNTGEKLGDAIGKLTEKMPWPKKMSPKAKSMTGGVIGTTLGAGLLIAGAQVAVPAFALGSLLGWFGILPGFAAQLGLIGTGASLTAVVGKGMIDGADKHGRIKTRFVSKLDRGMDRVENLFKRTKAPSVTGGKLVPPAPEAPTKMPEISAADKFADAQKPAQQATPAAKLPAPKPPQL